MSARMLIATFVAAAGLSALVVGTVTPVVFAGGPAERGRDEWSRPGPATKGRKPPTASATPTPTPTPTPTASSTAPRR